MKRKIFPVLHILFLTLLIWCGPYPARAGTPVSPAIHLPEERFAFSPVLEGREVRHDFIVLNKGTSLLDIVEVKTDCGCTTISYTRQIPPGGEGRIAVRLDTTGYGGEHVIKMITVRTNDEKKPEFDLAIMGEVRPFAVITPKEANLTGMAGQQIKQTVTIAPTRENPFRVVEVKAEKGENIRCELAEMKKPDGMKYRLTVYNMKQDKGWYIDNISLKTTSKLSPILKIRVFGVIRNAQ
jgi:hypothetical protein